MGGPGKDGLLCVRVMKLEVVGVLSAFPAQSVISCEFGSFAAATTSAEQDGAHLWSGRLDIGPRYPQSEDVRDLNISSQVTSLPDTWRCSDFP